ncbi:MAG: sigma-70 family RNA polymerase sigma factor [Oscillospiraceae bacterium]|nr:sigma-70 family RNA polymerase sigma factor [Oscillospiraceae bacterium]
MMEFTFEMTPFESVLADMEQGSTLSGLRCLALLEGLSEDEAEEALLALEQRQITLDISDLPPCQQTGELAVRLRREQKLAEARQLPDSLEKNDPLRLYLEEIAAIPAAGDENRLAMAYLDGDDSVIQNLVNLNLSRVTELAFNYTGRGVLLLDLIQEGSLGLWQGILNYTGGDFAQHILWWIRQYLAKAVLLQLHIGEIGQKLRQGMEDYRDADQRLLADLGRNPTLEEIAEAIHISTEDAAVYQNMMLQARTRQQIDQSREPRQPEPEDEQAVENTAYFQARQRILEMLSVLSEQEAKVLTLRFGLEGGLPQTPEQTGQKMHMTSEEVVALEAVALNKLRHQEG